MSFEYLINFTGMNSLDKYYTPSNEEFHVGFQYQSLRGVEDVNGDMKSKPIKKG